MKKDGRSLSHDVLESFRFSAVKLFKKQVPVIAIAESFGVTSEAVYIWLKKARTLGVKSLKSTIAPGAEPRLSRDQYRKLISILKRPAVDFGYSTDLWTGSRVRHIISKKFRVRYHPKHISRFLRRIGLQTKFPERRALEQDPKAVREWKEVRLPEILDYAVKVKALVFYADESLISLIPYIGKTWTFPKMKVIARVSGKRGQHVGVTAAVNKQGRMSFELTRENERFTAVVFIRFIRHLRKDYPRKKVVLIADGAKPHIANAVKDFVLKNKSWLRIEKIPAYSPELNPSEGLWGFVKTKKMNGSTEKDKKGLRKKTKLVMSRLKKRPERIASFFKSKN